MNLGAQNGLIAVGAWDSAIGSEFRFILCEFCGKQFSFPWRGGRDGFDVRDFHRRCDRAPPLKTQTGTSSAGRRR
jgi:hypothetical protein